MRKELEKEVREMMDGERWVTPAIRKEITDKAEKLIENSGIRPVTPKLLNDAVWAVVREYY